MNFKLHWSQNQLTNSYNPWQRARFFQTVDPVGTEITDVPELLVEGNPMTQLLQVVSAVSVLPQLTEKKLHSFMLNSDDG